jgi:hypothetical protein
MKDMSTPNQNILQLRQLAEKLCMQSIQHEYKDMILSIKSLCEENKKLIADCKTDKEKLKCYEAMHAQVDNLLQQIKISE